MKLESQTITILSWEKGSFFKSFPDSFLLFDFTWWTTGIDFST